MATFLGIIAVIIVIMVLMGSSRAKELEQLKQAYDRALQSGDKKAALSAGRSYFSKLRNGKLTIYDEQALTNDLMTMK